ncbi:DNA helicase RecQ [Microscilla marina]|uniref:DNA helicase RecQ n=1 Tax=Microscilla marina ATCC 23134 TaxID=313606 RepID=A1ZED7_MICM2|nr:DNA helicase RecQ [Microscilla marina]EAY31445.1 ATP-dependent DNA helicase RecQ [Microscilla marina ATCC 23134]
MHTASPEATLQQYFGYKQFRPLQKDIIDQVLAGNDALVLMPTGGGKSLCYQVPALMMEGIAIVVSPLIALMQDQVEALQRNDIAAAFYNSTQTSSEQSEIERQCMDGKIKLLYVSPEKLLSGTFIEFLQRLQINLFAIDEAHCISSWGHDFRPEYAQLKMLKKVFPSVPVVALTATADKTTRNDILNQLNLQQPETFLASFDRENIRLHVSPGQNRIKKIIKYLETRPNQSGIIYCLSRKSTEQIAQKLKDAGFSADYYHAKMDSNRRAAVQQSFLKDDTHIICATIAFGMGIDKPNVRFVIHYNMPKNVEGYYQEIGRAGRDGLKSDAILFYSYGDVKILREFIHNIDNEGFKALQFAKLERMLQFADADICRRRILLNYFNENFQQDCGNCDVCRNPPQKFDGTILAQKALSACLRVKQQVGINALIDVLRGAKNQQIIENGYHQIKTFGAGKDVSFQDWRDYLQQMINLGVFEIAYDQNLALKTAELGNQILAGAQKLLLSKPTEKTFAKAPAERPKSKKAVAKEGLFEALRTLRKQIADSQSIAPHIIFNDATLTEMSDNRPYTKADFLEVSGVTQTKMEQYGQTFINEIVRVSVAQYQAGATVKGASPLTTYQLYKQGLTPKEIVAERAKAEGKALNPVTVEGHLISLYKKGYSVDLMRFTNATAVSDIQQVLHQDLGEDGFKGIHEQFGGKYSYFEIRIAKALLGE